MGAINRNGIIVPKISDFYPIPALQRADADVSIILLVGNGADSLGLYQDKWYQADLPAPDSAFRIDTLDTRPSMETDVTNIWSF